MGKMLGAMTSIIVLQFALFFLVGSCLTEDLHSGECTDVAEFHDFTPGTALFNLIKDAVSLDGGTCSVEGLNWTSTNVSNRPECLDATDSEGNPGEWIEGEAFWQWIVGLIAVVGLGGGIVVVGLYITKPDFAFYLAIAGALAITEGPVYWNAFNSIKIALCSSPEGCMIPVEVVALFMCIFIIPWVIIILDYARGRD